jgi:hypothetical protein
MAVHIDGDGREWVSADAMDRVIGQRDTLLRAIAEHKDELSNGPTANTKLADDRLYQAASLIGEEGDLG